MLRYDNVLLDVLVRLRVCFDEGSVLCIEEFKVNNIAKNGIVKRTQRINGCARVADLMHAQVTGQSLDHGKSSWQHKSKDYP